MTNPLDNGVPPGHQAGSDKPTRTPPTTLYIVNLILLGLTSAGVAIYVRCHFAPAWNEQWVALVGGGVSVWTFIETLNSLILKTFGKGIMALFTKGIRALLREKRATYALATVLVLVLTAFAGTSSMFLSCADENSTDAIEVQITPKSFPYNQLVIDGTHRIAGGRMYFATGVELHAKTVRPYRQCTEETISFHSWSAIKFKGPARLPCFQYRIVRLVPFGSLWDELPRCKVLKPYYVQLKIGDGLYPKSPILLHRQIIEIGAPVTELPEQVDDDAKSEIRKLYADLTPGISADQLTAAVNHVTVEAPLRIATPMLNSGTILVNIYDHVDAATPIRSAIPVTISGRTMSSSVPVAWKSP
jgi:hypothetical protein